MRTLEELARLAVEMYHEDCELRITPEEENLILNAQMQWQLELVAATRMWCSQHNAMYTGRWTADVVVEYGPVG